MPENPNQVDGTPDQHPVRDQRHLLQPTLESQPLSQTARPTSQQTRPSDMPLPPSYRRPDITRNNPHAPTEEALTKYARRQNQISGTAPLDNQGRSMFDQRDLMYTPGLLTSIKRNIIEDGLFQNSARWIEQQHASMIDTDPEESQKIRDAMPELMQGLAPSDQEYIQDLPTFELAEREAQRIRDQRYYEMLRQDEGFLHSLAAGIGGFILDPINLVPGALILKGTRLSSNMLSIGSRASAQAPARGGIVANALKWGAFGGAEELARSSVRYQADPLFQEREYRAAVFMAMGFGGAIPLIPSAYRGSKTLGKHGLIELERIQKGITQSEAGVGFAQTLRSARTFMSDVDTSSAKAFREMDKGQVWQDAKADALEKTRTSGSQLRGESIKENAAKAKTAVDEGKYTELSDETLDIAVDALVDAGNLTKDLAKHFINSVKGGIKANIRVAQIVKETAQSNTARRAGKKAGEKIKEKVVEVQSERSRQADIKKSKVAAEKSRQSLKNTRESINALGKNASEETQTVVKELNKAVGDLQIKMNMAEERIRMAQEELDTLRNSKDPEISAAARDSVANRDDAVAHFKAINEKVSKLDRLIKEHSKPAKMPKNPTAADVAAPGNIHKPDKRGEINDALSDLENSIDYDGPGFGSDTAGAARVNDIRTKKEKALDDLKDIADDTVRRARAEMEVLAAARDEILAKLPPGTTEEMKKNIVFLYDRKIRAIASIADHRAAMRGVRPAFVQLKDAATQAMETLRVALPESAVGFRKVEAELIRQHPELKGSKIAEKLTARLNDAIRSTLLREVKRIGDDKMFKDINFMTDAGMEAGIRKVFEVHENSPFKRQKFAEQMTRNWEKGYASLREDISFQKVDSKVLDDVFTYIDNNADFMTGKFDLVEAQLKSPLEDLLKIDPKFQEMSEQFEAAGWGDLIEEQFVNNKLNQALAKQAGGLTHSLSSQLLGTGVPLIQNLSLRLFETSAGFGGEKVAPTNTAAIVADNIHNQILVPYQRAYKDFQKEWAKEQGWSWLQEKANYKGHSEGYPDIAKMHEAVAIEQNARMLGKEATTESAAVSKFLDAVDDGYKSIHDIQIESGITGVSENNRIKHHQRQVWNEAKLLQISATKGGKEGLIELFSQGLIKAGHSEANAYTLATGFFETKHAQLSAPRLGSSQRMNEQIIKGAMPDIQTVVSHIREKGASETQIREIVNIINENSADIDGPGYMNHQMKADYTAETMINGKTVRLIDILDLDMPGHFERQSKESSALVAINDAFDGQMPSYSAIDDYIQASANQAQAMGGKNMAREMRNAIGMMTGRDYDGQLPPVMRMIRGHLNLTGMGGLLESQLAEMGLALTRGIASLTALKQVKDARKADFLIKHGKDPDSLHWALQQNRELLAEMQSLTGNTPDIAGLAMNNVIFDESTLATGRAPNLGERIIDKATGGKYRPALASIQTNLTGYGKARAFEDDVANMSVLNDLARRFIDPVTRELLPEGVPGKSTTSDARWADMGVDVSEQGFIRKLFDPVDGYITIDEGTGNIAKLNVDEMPVSVKRQLGVILGRNSSRQIQKGYVGETSPMLMNPWWAFAAQFRSYTMIAAEKQQVRNMKFGDKEFATGLVLNAASSAFSRVVRIHSLAMALPKEDREDFIDFKMQNIGYETMKYMAMASTLPELTGMINQLVGQPFGAHPAGAVRGGDDLIPAFSYFSRLTQLEGIPTSDGEMARMQSMIQLGTISQANLLFGVIRNALYGEANESQ